MKTLNLTNNEKSDIKFQIYQFPDGQQQVVINPKTLDDLHVIIKSRLNNFRDLELIICAVKSLRNLGVKEIHLYTPYFLGSRSDRQFEIGSNNYLKDVICPIINSLNFESVTVLDPHSDVIEACLTNYRKESNLALIQSALRGIISNETDRNKLTGSISNDFILVSPDAGASKKIYKLAEQIGYKGDIITCSKDRDEQGNLTKTVVPDENGTLGEGKDVIIIDDICDGGATFINMAKEIKPQMATQSKLYLIVTHGIFSKGYSELVKYFDGIYCTNSYSNTLKGSFFNYDTTDFVKQLNIF